MAVITLSMSLCKKAMKRARSCLLLGSVLGTCMATSNDCKNIEPSCGLLRVHNSALNPLLSLAIASKACSMSQAGVAVPLLLEDAVAACESRLLAAG